MFCFFLFGHELAQGGGNKVRKRKNEREVGKREGERKIRNERSPPNQQTPTFGILVLAKGMALASFASHPQCPIDLF